MPIRAFKIGFITTDTEADLWYGVANCIGSTLFDSFARSAAGGALSKYQVPAGKTLYIGKIILLSSIAAVGAELSISTASIAGAAGPPAGNIYLSNANFLMPVANTILQVDVLIPVPTGMYVNLKPITGTGEVRCMAFGVVI